MTIYIYLGQAQNYIHQQGTPINIVGELRTT